MLPPAQHSSCRARPPASFLTAPPRPSPSPLQGVEASTLMAAALRADRKAAAAAAGPVEHQQDVLQAAFKRERRLQSEEDPHM